MAIMVQGFLDTVLAIGVGEDETKRSWVGSGFLYGDLVTPDDDPKKRRYKVWLITNKHVLTGKKIIYLKFNSTSDEKSKDYALQLIDEKGGLTWFGHPNISTDVAAIFINHEVLEKEGRKYQFFACDVHTRKKEQLKADGISEGDEVFILGFPMGLVIPEKQYAICRGGVIARIRDYLDGKASDILLDATVFPGNSGGPAILRITHDYVIGSKPISKSDLIGIVKSYVPYEDVAVSQQTLKPRVIFQENSGLTLIEPVDAIDETIAIAKEFLLKNAK